ncbi:hypothetical protein GCM10010213_00690 [Microbacterium maritypicum]|nr:hypothetical protein GCM10010213_00690 [Microbacterium liquefaciens]
MRQGCGDPARIGVELAICHAGVAADDRRPVGAFGGDATQHRGEGREDSWGGFAWGRVCVGTGLRGDEGIPILMNTVQVNGVQEEI